LLYGYTNYSRAGFRDHLLRWTNIPEVDGEPRGSMLGGAGLAVSARATHLGAAVALTVWVAEGGVQGVLDTCRGGQPAHVAAWAERERDALAAGFCSGTRRTLDLASLRPRHPGYMVVQDAACARVHRGLVDREAAASVLADLDQMFLSLTPEGTEHAGR